MVFRLLCVLCLAQGLSACTLLWSVDADQPWQANVVRPAYAGPIYPGELGEDTGHYLYVLTDAKGFDFSTPVRFLRTLHKHPRGGKNDDSVGHSWLLLESPDDLLECGHTGEFGIESDRYYTGVNNLVLAGDPDPIRYLHTPMEDGEYQPGPGPHLPSFVARFRITAEEHASVYDYIEAYNYAQFSVTERQCTDFVAGALRLIGIAAANRMSLALPDAVSYGPKDIRLWTDPQYSRLTIGFPDVLEHEMRALVDLGVAQDATQWYFE